MRAWKVRYILQDPLFYASRELGSCYITEPVLTSYGQPYALGLVRSSFRLVGKAVQVPTYVRDLEPLNDTAVYLMPAGPTAPVKMQTERFNVMPETYWYAMAQGVVAADLSFRFGRKARAVNMPQQGMLRLVARGQVLESVLFAAKLPKLPTFCRLGKFMSKARVEVEAMPPLVEDDGEYDATGLINPLDLPSGTKPVHFERLNIRPVPLLRHARLVGPFWRSGSSCFPRGQRYVFSS